MLSGLGVQPVLWVMFGHPSPICQLIVKTAKLVVENKNGQAKIKQKDPEKSSSMSLGIWGDIKVEIEGQGYDYLSSGSQNVVLLTIDPPLSGLQSYTIKVVRYEISCHETDIPLAGTLSFSHDEIHWKILISLGSTFLTAWQEDTNVSLE